MTQADIMVVGVVGAGAMGRGIAQIAAHAGLTGHLFDTNVYAVAAACRYLQDTFAKLAENGKLSVAESDAALARVKACNVLEDLASCDLVVESIVEKLEIKRDPVAKLEGVLREDALIASNTSSLSITAIAVGAKKHARIVGYHFFNPVLLIKVVEVIDGLSGDPAVGDSLMELSRRMGHTPVRCKDMPGFIVNHAGRGMNVEGLTAAQEGVAEFVDIDNIMREQAGFRMGPFELMDLTGLLASCDGVDQFYKGGALAPSPITQVRYTGGALGRKTGFGFYAYR